MRYSVLASSSSGNCVYLEANKHKYLLDCGLSLRQILLRLNRLGVELDSLDGIFITHEHSDHILGLCGILSKYKTKIYMSKSTYKGLPDKDKDKISPIYFSFLKKEEEFELNGIKILPFALSHDANDPIGYKFIEDDKTLVYLTDTGTFEYREDLYNASSYILESNHEVEMLKLSNRPWPLINRIMSKYGHLSNEDSAKLFIKLKGENTKSLVLYHLSKECNTKDLALLQYELCFKENNIDCNSVKLVVSSSESEIEFIEV